MIAFIFTKQTQKAFSKLSKSVQKRVIEKLEELRTHDDILSILKRLINFEPATHRLRIGDYRLILALRDQTEKDFEFYVLDIGHRKDIYR